MSLVFLEIMSGTRQVNQPLDESVTLPRPKREWHSTVIHDHRGRPFQSIWKGDASKRPRISWHVYTTSNIDEGSVDKAKFLGGLKISE